MFAKTETGGFQKGARAMLIRANQYAAPIQIAESTKQKNQREFKEYTATMAVELGRKATSLDLKFLAHLLFVAAQEAAANDTSP